MSPDHDLRSLGPVQPAGSLVSRVRRAAHGELLAVRRPRWRVATLRWAWRVLPAAIALTVGGYLHWALQAASALYR
ncbi:MAG: hypothetical protein M3O36_07875 [Myxococcota bacterium]|nr:hypothetical protein [Myxococcota bacterium]